MDEREATSTGKTKPVSDLLEIAAQLAALAEDIKILAEKPISTSLESDDNPEVGSE
ncbi:hypothetical protein ILFOPFJJ_05509 [Ensifer psoraleae]|uniref:hypothetical protein n=1 Tax=Sinorhizobium TaxID=28105 RepID=UPI001568A479|nr:MULTISPECIES: hypothetical protein [Sinorhizobium]MDK1389590.1 hypothetical protein [Sinorhizobium sp. 7-81]NRP74587.1 hypothetical protein [Sinorhizobium psoraleae]